MEPNDRDSDRMKQLKQELQSAAPTSPLHETPEGIGHQRGILRQMDAERLSQDTARNEAQNQQEAERERERLAKMVIR